MGEITLYESVRDDVDDDECNIAKEANKVRERNFFDYDAHVE